MTVEDLKTYLIQYSPFKIKGESNDLYCFYENYYSINDKPHNNYILSKLQNNFFINNLDLFPFLINIKVLVRNSNEESQIIVNQDLQLLKNNSYRHKDAENGYLLLQPFAVE